MMKIAHFFQARARAVTDSFVLFALLAAATGCAYVFDPYLSLTSQGMLFVLAVVIAAYRLGRGASVLAAFAAVATLNFFFVAPRWTFQVEHPENLIALMTMLVVALVINRLAAGMRRATELAQIHEQRARQLQSLVLDLSNAADTHEVQALGQGALDAAFSAANFLCLCGANGQLETPAGLSTSVRDGMLCCMKESVVIGAGTGRWSELDAWYLPLGDRRAGRQIGGAVCIESVAQDDDAGRAHALALCSILAQALWRLRLSAEMLAAQAEAQRQQLQGIFLAAISHDLRTPLAVVMGAASALQLQGDKLSAAEQQRLLASIVTEAGHLSSVTENTLQLVRLANSSQALARDWEAMEEIVGAVLARVRLQDTGRRIVSKVHYGLPLVKVDPVLIAQVLTNLLDNALKYTDQAIHLTVSVSAQNAAQQMLVAVKDRGPGIAESDQKTIFEPYARGDHSDRARQRGTGLGLAVCRVIAQAHGGNLILRRRTGGGSSFTLALPVEALPAATMEEQAEQGTR